jgi:hypothetical protein
VIGATCLVFIDRLRNDPNAQNGKGLIDAWIGRKYAAIEELHDPKNLRAARLTRYSLLTFANLVTYEDRTSIARTGPEIAQLRVNLTTHLFFRALNALRARSFFSPHATGHRRNGPRQQKLISFHGLSWKFDDDL